MTKDEALRLALEALENLGNHDHVCPQWPTYAEPENYPKCNCGYDQAITAIKAALEAKDEPVAWSEEIIDDLHALYDSEMIKENDSGDALIRLDEAVCVVEEVAQRNTTQPQQEAKDEPVAWFSTLPDGKLSIKIVGKPTEGNWEPLYTTPPQRTWVGLTDKDWNRSGHNQDFQKGVDWAEAMLKGKNI
jgi:hypothetical protein